MWVAFSTPEGSGFFFAVAKDEDGKTSGAEHRFSRLSAVPPRSGRRTSARLWYGRRGDRNTERRLSFPGVHSTQPPRDRADELGRPNGLPQFQGQHSRG